MVLGIHQQKVFSLAGLLTALALAPISAIAQDDTFQKTLQQAQTGDAEAQRRVGIMYRNGRGVAENAEEAAKWLRAAAEQGNALAQTNLGFMYVEGRGVRIDEAEASKWFRAAAEQGYAGAQSILGNSYKLGLGVPQDYHEAVKWYRSGAKQGHPMAQAGLGKMYEAGHGVPQDYSKAYLWFNLAVANGDVNVVDERDAMAAKLPAELLATAQQQASACMSSGYDDCD